MKILFVFTGGTIGSSTKNGIISPDGNVPDKLIDNLVRETRMDFDYDVSVPEVILSENSSGDFIREVVSCVSGAIDSYDGIIVMHGTDTIQYTAAALSYSLGLCPVPVCLVSANRPADCPDSNAPGNFCAALSFIQKKHGQGVFVPYQNREGEVLVHRASRLLPHSPYSHELYSLGGAYGVYLAGEFSLSESYFERDDTCPPLPFGSLCRTAGILRVAPYPGMIYPEIPEGVSAVLHGSYHSGTIGVSSPEAAAFFEKARERGVAVYLTGVAVGDIYGSSLEFSRFHIRVLPQIAPDAAYMKLWMCLSSGLCPDEYLGMSLGGDILFPRGR